MVVSDVALGGLSKAMEGLTSQLKSSMEFAMRADKASAALGMTFEQTNDQLGGTMEGLRGDMNQRFAGAIAGMEAGLQGNTQGIARLVNQQRLTGTASAGTAKAMATLEAQLGLSRDQTNKLSNSLIETGAEWQISTDKLVGAVTSLEASFPAQAMAGMGDKVTGAMVELTAQLPQGMHKQLNSVMNMVMDTSMEGFERLAKLNIGGVREQLSAAKNSEEAAQILQEAFKTASSEFNKIGGGAESFYASLGVAAETFGPAAINFTTVSEAFGTRVKQEGADAEAFGNQLGVIKDEIMIPLQEMLKEFFPIIKGVGILIGTVLRNGITIVVDAFAKMFIKMGGFSGVIDTVKKTISGIRSKFKLIKDITIPLLIGALATLTAMAVGLGVALFPIIWPFLLFGTIIAAMVAGFKALKEKTQILEKVTGFLSEAFQTFKNGLGELLIKLGDMYGVPDKLADWGRALQESAATVRKNKEVAQSAKDQKDAIDNMNHSELMGELGKTLKVNKEEMGLTEKIKDSTEKTARNTTIDIKTNPEFLDQTANMLGRSMESILGINKDNSAAKIVEELRALNEQTSTDNSIAAEALGETAAQLVALNDKTTDLVEKPGPENAPALGS
mgnify:CR=1 FL=1